MKCKPRLKLNHIRSIILFIHPWSGAEEECLMKELLIQNQLIEGELIKENTLLVRQPWLFLMSVNVFIRAF